MPKYIATFVFDSPTDDTASEAYTDLLIQLIEGSQLKSLSVAIHNAHLQQITGIQERPTLTTVQSYPPKPAAETPQRQAKERNTHPPVFICKRGYNPPSAHFHLLNADQLRADPDLDQQSKEWLISGSVVGSSSDATHKYYYDREQPKLTAIRLAARKALEHLEEDQTSDTPHNSLVQALRQALQPLEGIPHTADLWTGQDLGEIATGTE